MNSFEESIIDMNEYIIVLQKIRFYFITLSSRLIDCITNRIFKV